MLKLLGGSRGILPQKILKIWALRNAISRILSQFQTTFIVFYKKKYKTDVQTIFEIQLGSS